jgi:hypothetical protein
MAAPKKIPVAPPTFHLKVRLVDSTGKPFAGKDFQLWWGGKLVKEDVLDVDGYMEADVDDKYDSGLLDIGEKDKNTGVFVARWTIPVEVVAPPPPPPLPKKPAKATPEKKPSPPRAEWTDENDPHPPYPTRERNSDDYDGIIRYRHEKRAWDEWEARRKERMETAERQKQRDQDWMDHQQVEDELRRKTGKPGASGRPIDPLSSPHPPMSDAQQKDLQERLRAFRNAYHDTKVLIHGIAWRLRNLGYLPDLDVPVFPVEGFARDRVLDAMQRYAWKNKLPVLETTDLDGIPSANLTKVDEVIRKEHDG